MLRCSIGLASLVIAAALQAVIGARTNVAQQMALRRGEARHFALSPEHVADLCTEAVMTEASRVLGAAPPPGADAEATPAQFAEVLAADASEAAGLLEALGLSGTAPFTCRAFCEAAVSNIPKLLSAAAPARAGLACTDRSCEEQQVDVSEEALVEQPLAAPLAPEAADRSPVPVDDDGAGAAAIDPAAQRRILFRTALNLILGVFPYAEEVDDETAECDPVAFGKCTRPERHFMFRQYLQKASAWVAAALRRLSSGEAHVRKWFIMETATPEEIDAQVHTVRGTLTKMLRLMSYISIQKGPECDDAKVFQAGVAYTAAYVQQFGESPLQVGEECGERDVAGRYIVNVCEFFWGYFYDEGMRVGTLVHETSHHFGTVDKGYCDAMDCLSLSPDSARSNADTYRELIEQLVTSLGDDDKHLSRSRLVPFTGPSKAEGTPS